MASTFLRCIIIIVTKSLSKQMLSEAVAALSKRYRLVHRADFFALHNSTLMLMETLASSRPGLSPDMPRPRPHFPPADTEESASAVGGGKKKKKERLFSPNLLKHRCNTKMFL